MYIHATLILNIFKQRIYITLELRRHQTAFSLNIQMIVLSWACLQKEEGETSKEMNAWLWGLTKYKKEMKILYNIITELNYLKRKWRSAFHVSYSNSVKNFFSLREKKSTDSWVSSKMNNYFEVHFDVFLESSFRYTSKI